MSVFTKKNNKKTTNMFPNVLFGDYNQQLDVSHPYDLSMNQLNAVQLNNSKLFYEQLNKEDDDEEENVDKCLISNLPLDTTKVEFKCGHKFNYFYIFNETINSKKVNNNINSSEKLSHGTIRCPYCRTIYNNLLPPPFDILGTQELIWINSPNKLCMTIKCNHDDCTSKKIYVTPLGQYCKKHYIYLKSDGEIDANYEENETQNELELDNNIKLSGHEMLDPQWKSYNHYKVIELKEILKAKGLKVSGTKPVLISRLLNNNVSI